MARAEPFMNPSLSTRNRNAAAALTDSDLDRIMAHARSLADAARQGIAPEPRLRGRMIGLLCEADDTPGAALFCRAARELGAHVAQVRPSLSERSTPLEIRHTAEMLGRLYDALACEGTSALARQLGEHAGIPVYDGIAAPQHPSAALVERLEGDAQPLDKRRYVLQAVLLATLT
jgi:ornithine carbamoyltransferase